jgi:hypothetical protein
VHCVYDCTKVREVRTQQCARKRIGRLPVRGDVVCLFAGNLVVWCVIERVLKRRMIEDIVCESNYTQYVPWLESLHDALSLYRKLDDGSGYVSMQLNPPFQSKNLQ